MVVVVLMVVMILFFFQYHHRVVSCPLSMFGDSLLCVRGLEMQSEEAYGWRYRRSRMALG